MSNRILTIGSSLIVLLAAGLVYLIIRTEPSSASIEAAKQAPPALPSVNLQLLESGALTNRTSNGTLPINIDGLGRTDPFAGA